MLKIASTVLPVIKHLWQSWWGSHQRRYDFNTFTPEMVRYKSDFSATLDINPQDKLNCAISAHAIQTVMIFSLLPLYRSVTNRSGLTYTKRFIRNIGINFWACGNYSLSNNYYFHFKCLAWAVIYLNRRFRDEAVQYMVGYIDGCPDQYKSGLNAIMVGGFCDSFGLEEYIHHFAPTASFKTNTDAFGSDTKTYIADGERKEKFDVLQRRTSSSSIFKKLLQTLLQTSEMQMKRKHHLKIFLLRKLTSLSMSTMTAVIKLMSFTLGSAYLTNNAVHLMVASSNCIAH